MTDSIQNYRFDFANEVQRLRRDLGELAEKILFIDAKVLPHRDSTPDVILSHVIGGKRLNDKDIEKLCGYVTGVYEKNPWRSPSCHRLNHTDSSAGAVIYFSDIYPGFKDWGAENESMIWLFTLYHETAHALFPGPPADENDPFRECLADAYAALRLLQRFGHDAAPLLSLRSWARCFEAIKVGTGHFSTLVLDKIIADSAAHNFSSLPHAEIMKLAQRYAEDGTPPAEMLKKARQLFAKISHHVGGARAAHCIAEAALNSKSQLAAYVGAKYIDPFLQRNGGDIYGYSSAYSFMERHRYKKLIKKQVNSQKLPAMAELLGIDAKPSGLRRLFNRSAKKTFTEFLQVSVPAGQKRFSFKPR